MTIEEIKSVLREVVMRNNLAFPETEKDLEWFESRMLMSAKDRHKLINAIANILELGKID